MGKGGCEFLVIFDDGKFSEDSTFLLSDWISMLHPSMPSHWAEADSINAHTRDIQIHSLRELQRPP